MAYHRWRALLHSLRRDAHLHYGPCRLAALVTPRAPAQGVRGATPGVLAQIIGTPAHSRVCASCPARGVPSPSVLGVVAPGCRVVNNTQGVGPRGTFEGPSALARSGAFRAELCPLSLSASRSGPAHAQGRLNLRLRPRGCDTSGDALAVCHSPLTDRAAHHLRSACHLPQELQPDIEPPATADDASTFASLVEAAALHVIFPPCMQHIGL